MIPTRTAVVGAGRIADEHMTFLARNQTVDFVAVCDLDPVLAQRAKRLYGAKRAYGELQTLLKHEQPEILHVLTPPLSHAGLIEQGLAAGAHIIVEKPASTTRRELETALALARKVGRWVTEDQNYRFNQPVLALHNLLEAGHLGRVREVTVRMSVNLGEGRFGDKNGGPSVPEMPGGPLHEFLPHLAYLAAHFLPEPSLIHSFWAKADQGNPLEFDDLIVQLGGSGGSSGTIRFCSAVSPTDTSIQVRGDLGDAEAFLQVPRLQVNRMRGGGPQLSPLLNEVTEGLRRIQAGGCGLLAKLRGSPIYEGIGVFLGQTYAAHQDCRALPVSTTEMLAAADLVDKIVAEKP